MNKVYKVIAILVTLGMLVSVLPKPSYAQNLQPDTEPAPEMIEELKSAYAQRFAQGPRSTGEISKVEVKIFSIATTCEEYARMDDEVIPDEEFNHNFLRIDSTEQAPSLSGNHHYESGGGHARLTTNFLWSPEEGVALYGQVYFRSEYDQTVLVSEIGSDGNIRAWHYVDVPGDNQWHLWQERVGEVTLTISTDQYAPKLEVDAMRVMGCPVNFTHLPTVTGDSPDPVPCDQSQQGRWLIGSETKEMLAQDLLLETDKISIYIVTASGRRFVCWDKDQTEAFNPATGERLDFQGVDRATKSSVHIVALMRVPGQSLPWWSTEVVAISSRVAGVAVRYLVAVSPWALLLGIGIGVIWLGWRLYLASQNAKPLHEPVELLYELNGRQITATYLQLAPDDLLEAGSFYIYRFSEILTSSGWVPEFDRAQMVAIYQTATGNPAQGFALSTQRIDGKIFIDQSYTFDVSARVADAVAQKKGATDDDSTSDEAKELANQIEKWLAEGPKPAPIDPGQMENFCERPIDLRRIGQDLQMLWSHSGPMQFVAHEMLGQLMRGFALVTYSAPQGSRVTGTDATVTFDGFVFEDGKLHTLEYYCGRLGKVNLWFFLGVKDGQRILPYR